MAHKKAGGSSRNGRDSQPKMLGVKAYGGESVSAGSTSGWGGTIPCSHWWTAPSASRSAAATIDRASRSCPSNSAAARSGGAG